MTEALFQTLATPPGQPGSGRVRYGAAMALFRAGLMSEAQLEVYRAAAARDAADPALLLAERGLPVPPAPAGSPETALRTLVDEADRYLATLPGPGVAEVRAGLNAARGGPVRLHPQDHPVVAAHLAVALAQLAPGHPALAAAIAAAAPHLNWHPYDSYPPEQIGPGFASGHAYASIIGEDSALPAIDYDLGVFLIAPHVLYRDHCHKAPELYAPLTGPHGWRFGPGTPLMVKPAHAPVWNPPERPHLTKVGPTPFLCLFGWTRDVNDPARVLPASDWPELEALRL
jgi:hypothetical protein